MRSLLCGLSAACDANMESSLCARGDSGRTGIVSATKAKPKLTRPGHERRARASGTSKYNTEQVPALIFQIWITPTPTAAPLPGVATVSQGDRSGRFVAFASGFESDIDALPIRARARVLGAKLESAVCRICVWRTTARLPGAFVGHRRRQRRENSRA